MEVTVALSSERVFLAVKISRTLLFLGFLVGLGRALSDPLTDVRSVRVQGLQPKSPRTKGGRFCARNADDYSPAARSPP